MQAQSRDGGSIPIHTRAEKILRDHAKAKAFQGDTGRQLAFDLEALTRAGCYFVLANSKKAARQKGWNDLGTRRADFHAARWLAKDPARLIGCIPSTLGCTVFDIDTGGRDGAVALMRMLGIGTGTLVRSQRPGGLHLWVENNRACEVGNRKWYVGDASGDVRSNSDGYCILWRLGAADAMQRISIDDENRPRLGAPMSWTAWVSSQDQRAARRVLNLERLPTKPLDRLPLAEVGTRNETLNHTVFRAVKAGREEDVEAAVRQAAKSGLGPEEIAATVRSARKAGELAAKADAPIAEGGEVFPTRNHEALYQALARLGIEVRFDVRGQRFQFRGGQYEDWTQSDDQISAGLRGVIELRFRVETSRGNSPLKFGADAWADNLNKLVEPHALAVDPFKEWLEESVPTWDGTERIESLLHTNFGAPDNALTRWASSHLFAGPVARAYEPGCLLRQTVVLIGKQGIGKSSLLRHILPVARAEWFSDGLHLADEPQRRAEALLGRVVVEASEMAGSTRADLESLKSFLTRTDDGSVRLAYRRDTKTAKRRCVIFGSSNTTDCLPNDPSGLDRFVPISLARGCNVERLAAAHRMQWWAEALHRRRTGTAAAMPRALLKAQAAVADRFRNADELMEDSVDRLRPAVTKAGMTLAEAMTEAGLAADEHLALELDSRKVKRFSAALRGAGWVKRRSPVDADGVRRMRWFAPTDWLND